MNAVPRLSPAADQLLHMLRHLSPHRQVYFSPQAGIWCLTHGDWRDVPALAIHELYRLGLIAPVYSNCPGDAFHVGRTLDCEATTEERKRGSKGVIYKPEGWRP